MRKTRLCPLEVSAETDCAHRYSQSPPKQPRATGITAPDCSSLFPACLCSQNPKETSLFCVISLDPNISASPLSQPEVTSNSAAPKEQHQSITKGRGELREYIWFCQLCFQAGSLYPRLEVTSQRGLSWKCCWTLQCSGPGRCSRSPRP